MAAAACSREEHQVARESVSPAASADSGAAQIHAEESAESSLAVKRGEVLIPNAAGRFAIRLCGQAAELAIQDHSGGVLAEIMASGAVRADQPVYVEAYGERRLPPRGTDAVFVLEQLLYAAPQGEGGGCDRPPPSYVVAARGNEPFWALEVTESSMVWRQPEEPTQIVFEPIDSQPAEGTVQYFASTTQHEVELLVGEQPCHDTMSGEFFAYTARAVLDGRELTGCARVGQ